MKRELLSKGPELLADLSAFAIKILQEKAGMDDDQAANLARDLVDAMRHYWGGQLVYFPKGLKLEIVDRDIHMYAEFNGYNHAVLAKKYDLSMQAVYNRLRIVRESKISENQADLFKD